MIQDTLPYPLDFDWQGHRGCRGLMPENTIPGFIKALEYPVKTIELDLVVTKDGQLLISHEPWMSYEICLKPNGQAIEKEEAMQLNIYQMDYSQVKKYDCGSRGNERFPEQQKHKVHKPLFKEMVEVIEAHCIRTKRKKPFYNIEIKSHPDGYGLYMPHPEIFVNLVLKEIKSSKIRRRASIQSFDPHVMNVLQTKNKRIKKAFLVEKEDGIEANLKKLGFTPDVYSPDYKLLTEEMVKTLHEKGVKIIPWTVNELEDMRRLISWGVDGIITDYPNLINQL